MENLFMDPIMILLLAHVKDLIIAFSDLHTLTTSMHCISPQEGKLFSELHGQHWAKLYDGDNHLLYGHGKGLYYFIYVHLLYATISYSLVKEITYIEHNVSSNHLPCNFLKL